MSKGGGAAAPLQLPAQWRRGAAQWRGVARRSGAHL